MSRRKIGIIILMVLAMFVTPSIAATPSENYAANCAVCHGANQEGGIGPAITPADLAASGIDLTGLNTILSTGSMSIYTTGMSATEISELSNWLLNPAPPVVLSTITVSPSDATLSIGDTQVFTATAMDENGDPMEGINLTWASSDNAVGTVSPENVTTGADGNATTTFTAIANGTATVNASSESISGSANVTVLEVVVPPVLTTITVSPTTATLQIGDIQEFTATAMDENGIPMEGINITWASSDNAVGTVSPENATTDANGNATTTFMAIANGTAMVNASNDSVSGSADVTVGIIVVPNLTTITVSPPNATLSIGDTPVFTATALDENNMPMEGINITWTSSNMTVGTVSPESAMTDANGTATTTFTAIANGTAMVNASNGSVAGSANVTVSEVVVPVLTKITVSPSNATLSIGNTSVFTATALDENNMPMEGINITWTSSNMTVGTVSPESVMTDANGTATTTFTAIANGTAMVNASNDSVSGSADVTVGIIVVPNLTTITVSPTTATLQIGDTPVFTATALDENNMPMEGINITWTSSNMTVGTVSPESVMTGADGTATTTFTALANGTSMVNATNGSVVGSADVVVSEEIEEVNLIKNPGFESGKQNWIFYTNGTGKFNIISPGFEGNNAAEIKLGKASSNMQLYQKGLTLEPNTHYRLSFAAKSSKGHDVRVVLLKHSSPFTNYGLVQNFNLTEDWQTFTTEFTTKRFTSTVNDGRLMFYLVPFAKSGDKYYFDSVMLEEI